jgi:hypothetical protein
MGPDKLKKGMRVRLMNGWEAVILGRPEGITILAKVYGAFTETGNIYLHDIAAIEVEGAWVSLF